MRISKVNSCHSFLFNILISTVCHVATYKETPFNDEGQEAHFTSFIYR